MRTLAVIFFTALCTIEAVPLDCPPCNEVPSNCKPIVPLSLNRVEPDYPCSCPTCQSAASLKANTDLSICEIKGQVYHECGTACPPTCADPDSKEFCSSVCVQGCQCPSGTVLDEITYECVKPKQCTCPRDCSKDFCTRPGNERALCNNPAPREMTGCSGQCQLTHCSACYYDDKVHTLSPDISCDSCGSPISSPMCLRRWANCVGMKDQEHYGKPDPNNVVSEKFKCYKYPCKRLLQ